MPTFRQPFEPDRYYHVFNHAVGRESLFIEERNYGYFLARWFKYIAPVADTLAYCLMPNHFHFLIFLRSDFTTTTNPKGFQNLSGLTDLDKYSNYISHCLGNAQNAYTKAYNKTYKRRGSLFCQSVHRRQVADEDYLRKLIPYIHCNPVAHGFTRNAAGWEQSSFQDYLNGDSSQVDIGTGLLFYSDREHFDAMHSLGIFMQYNPAQDIPLS